MGHYLNNQFTYLPSLPSFPFSLFVWGRVSLCSPSSTGSCYLNQGGLELKEVCSSPTRATTPGPSLSSFKKLLFCICLGTCVSGRGRVHACYCAHVVHIEQLPLVCFSPTTFTCDLGIELRSSGFCSKLIYPPSHLTNPGLDKLYRPSDLTFSFPKKKFPIDWVQFPLGVLPRFSCPTLPSLGRRCLGYLPASLSATAVFLTHSAPGWERKADNPGSHAWSRVWFLRVNPFVYSLWTWQCLVKIHT